MGHGGAVATDEGTGVGLTAGQQPNHGDLGRGERHGS